MDKALISLLESWKNRLEGCSAAGKFRAYAALLIDAPYVWGSENPAGTDCSGTVCFPLWMMGYNIRVTADVLFKDLFTAKELPPAGELIMAQFYVTKSAKMHGGRQVPAGTATHVTPYVGAGVVLNAMNIIRLDTEGAARDVFGDADYNFPKGILDWGKLKAMSDSGNKAWDVDPVLELLRQ